MSRSEQEVGFGLCMTSGAMDGLDKVGQGQSQGQLNFVTTQGIHIIITQHLFAYDIDDLLQDCCISMANALEIP